MKVNETLGYIFQVDAKMQEAERAQQLAEIKNVAKRHAKRMKKYREWSKPENIEKRRKEEAEQALLAELRTKELIMAMGGPQEDIPIPDPLPKHMQGQPLSTIKAMLRHEKAEKERG